MALRAGRGERKSMIYNAFSKVFKMEVTNRQPPDARVPGRAPSLFRGGVRSVNRLRDLKFDPIGELVKQYRKLQDEIVHQEQIRDGVRIELNLSGKPKAYRPEVHHALYDRSIKIAQELLRYGYGRVPEVSLVEQKAPQALIVNLTKKGEQYVVNEDDAPVEQPSIDDWGDDV